MALTGDSNARIQRAAAPTKTKAQIEADERAAAAAAKAAQIKRDQISSAAAFKASGLGAAGFISMTDSKAAAKAAPPAPPSTSKPSTSSKPSASGVDQAALDRAAQEAREKAAREAAEREAARREQERREAERRAEEARIAAIVAARPTVPKYLASTSVQPVKYASPADVLIQESSLPVDLILKQTLEKIGGLELISLVRHDTVNGQDLVYQPVKNLSQIEVLYNSQNIVKIPDSSETYFKNFAIKLESSIPQYDPDEIYLDMIDRDNNVFFDADNNRIVIELVNLKPDYEIEVQTVSLGRVFDDTIYDEDES